LRHIHARLRGFIEAPLPNISYDADNLPRRVTFELVPDAARNLHSIVQRIAVAPEFLGQAFTYDDDRRGFAVIAIIEEAAALERNIQRLEVAGRDRRPSR